MKIVEPESSIKNPHAYMKQLLIYDALFCLKHGIKPCDIQIENRIYQNDDALIANPTFEDINPVIEKIKEFDRVVREVKSGGDGLNLNDTNNIVEVNIL